MTPETMAALHADAFKTARAWSAEEFTNLLNARGTFAVGDDQAFALGRVIAGEAELLTIAVQSTLQGHGKGRHCLDLFHQAALERGAEEVFLEVAEDNSAAIALYLGAGYELTGRRENYYKTRSGNMICALTMRKPIGGNR